MHVVKLRDLGATGVNLFNQRYVRNLPEMRSCRLLLIFFFYTLTLAVTIDGYLAAVDQNLFHLHGGKMQGCRDFIDSIGQWFVWIANREVV